VELKERQNEVKSVAEEDALRKLLASDEDEQDEEQVDKESEEDKNEDDDGKEKDNKVSSNIYRLRILYIFFL